ncbi:MAG: hypothetical protein RSD95_08745 [Clostridia bacterium]
MNQKKTLDLGIRSFEMIRTLLAILLSFVAIGMVVMLTSDQPGEVLYWFVIGPVTSIRRIGQIFQVAIPFTICSLAFTVMLRAGKFNLCTDGVFYICMAFASMLALSLDLPPIIAPIVIILLCAGIGAVFALIPATLEYKWNANLVVAALMLNYVWLHVGRYILLYVINDPSLTYTGSYKFPAAATLSTVIPGTSVHTGLYAVIIVAIIVCVVIKRTRLGFSVTQVGNNLDFAKASGISVGLTALAAQAIGGAFIGVGGAVEVLGTYKQFKTDALLSYGGYALLITAVGKKDPKKVIIASILIAYMRAGAALVNSKTDIPLELADVLQGILVIFVAAELLFANMKHRWIVKRSELDIY